MEKSTEENLMPEIVSEEETDEYLNIPSPDAKRIVTDKLDISVRDLCERIRKKTLNPRPDYQRYVFCIRCKLF